MKRSKKFITWCDQAMACSVYALIYFLPISIALSEIFTGFILFFWLLKRGTNFHQDIRTEPKGWASLSFSKKALFFLKAFKPIDNCLNRPIAIFLFFNFLSLIFSRYPIVSIEGLFGKALQNTFLYFNFIEAVNSPKRLKTFFTLFFVSSTLIGVNGVYQYVFGHDFMRGHLIDDQRVSSTFRAHNDFAAYLIVIIPILLGLSVLPILKNVKQPSKSYIKKHIFSSFFSIQKRTLFFFIAILSFVCLGLTFSRGAWIALAFAILIFSVHKRKYVMVNGLLLILFFGIFYPRLKQIRQVSLITDSIVKKNNEIVASKVDRQVPDVSGGTQESIVLKPAKKELNIFAMIKEKLKSIKFSSGSGRSVYWMEAIHMIRDHPVFGSGLNTYSIVGREYKITWGGYPHNSYLQMAAEIGLPGLLSFLWLLGVVFYKSLHNLAGMQDPFLAMLLSGALTGYSGFLIHSFVDTNFYSVQLGSFMWIVMGIIIAVQKIDGISGTS